MCIYKTRNVAKEALVMLYNRSMPPDWKFHKIWCTRDYTAECFLCFFDELYEYNACVLCGNFRRQNYARPIVYSCTSNSWLDALNLLQQRRFFILCVETFVYTQHIYNVDLWHRAKIIWTITHNDIFSNEIMYLKLIDLHLCSNDIGVRIGSWYS